MSVQLLDLPTAMIRILFHAVLLQHPGHGMLVTNAAGIATNDKEKRQKSDKIDARKLCELLQAKKAKSIFIPELDCEQGRSLTRTRECMVSYRTRCKNRIRLLLHFSRLLLRNSNEASTGVNTSCKNCKSPTGQ